MHYKIIPFDAQESLLREVGQMMQVYEDRYHIKVAASPMYTREDLLSYAPPPGYFLSHMVTLGAEERFGANRNADAYPHEQLLRKHATFETHALNYREHRNQNPKDAIGVIKSARYDPDLMRGEALLWTKIKLAAAEFEKARRGEEQSGSMACKVPYDVCTACNFVSDKPGKRCDDILKKANQWIPERQAYATMRNFDPTFVDYSYVGRPADRIAFNLGYLMPEHMKAASEGRGCLTGYELGELYDIENGGYKMASDLSLLAEFDSRPEDPAKQAFHDWVLPSAINGQFPEALLDKMANHLYPNRVFRSLADRGMVLPLASFNSMVKGVPLSVSQNDPVVLKCAAAMPVIRIMIGRSLESDPGFASSFRQAMTDFEPSMEGCGDAVDGMMDKIRDQFSARYEALQKRAMFNIPASFLPPAEPDNEAFALGSLYSAYLLKTASVVVEGENEHPWRAMAVLSRAHLFV